MNEEYFTTSHGLRIGLQQSFFIDKLLGVYADDETAVSRYDQWLSMVEIAIRYPGTLMYVASLLFMIFASSGISIVNFIVGSCLIYIVGMFFKHFHIRVLDLFPLLITIVMYTTLCRNIIIKYAVLIAVAVFTSKYEILIAFLCVSIVMGIVNLIVVQLVHKINLKKYGKHFFDIEMIAFRRFNSYIDYKYRNVKALINDYLRDIM